MDTGRLTDSRGACIGIPARVGQLKSDVENGVIISELAAHDPISAIEAGEVRTFMTNHTIVVEVCQIDMIANARVLCKPATILAV